ncbi:RNA polymerase sigma factor SigF [Streptomyces platensis]|uniref:RNA polymerase sigma factor SigF n=1 Tax=Streptomyces platensis TaxID=58346 RepID=UPI002E0F4C15|nr:RNA polymerase sigma factor SigF [Streptomyces platensis]WTI50739.1 RNA polymerase sigma factor SigF [Streptomyces platensis]WUB83710.1 RNA polymerase sigma factor SigF [Streptomyces platensis]
MRAGLATSAVHAQDSAADTRTAPASSPEDLPHIEDPQNIAPRDARELTQVFFRRLETLDEGTHAYQYARNTLIEMNLSLVRYAARRFRNRGDDMDDILQVGTIGLIKAIDRYDVSRDVEFTTLAIPYITGEMRRFFRDTTWDVRVPRRLQELRVDLARAHEKLSGRLGRDPKVSELAAELDISEDEVVEGQVAANGYNASSIDATFHDDGNDTPLADLIGERDPEMDLVEDLHALAPLLNQLEERDRHILEMRFGQEMTQAQIGKELGVSQMHISRLLTRALTQLRAGLLNEE